MILITGASGKTGRALVRALADSESISALVHNDKQVTRVKSLGVERAVAADLHDETAIRSAMQGVRAVYHICPNMHPDETKIGELLIRVARENDVQHFVYHSVLHPQTEKMNHHWQKLRVEELIFESRLPFTILQPAPYMQNLLSGWRSILETGVLRVPYSIESKFSFVDLQDVAEAAKIVLIEPGHVNVVYELAGTTPMSHVEVADRFSRVLNRDVHAEQEDLGDWKLRVQESKFSGYALENLVRMFEYYDEWGLAGNPNVLRWVLRRVPTTIESFIQRTLKEYDTTH